MPSKTFFGRTLPLWQDSLIVLLVFLAYLPALHGGFVWDDDSWTTNLSALFQAPFGLRLIWFQPATLQQYYPLSGTTFWLDYQLWKFWTTPYHVENLLLHALAALLFWRLLLQLAVPGAWLAASLFALHPVMVESVAWITERKNVLSLVLYLGAWLAYGRFAPWKDAPEGVPVPAPPDCRWRRSYFYGLAFVLFCGALLAKTSAFPLPAAILLVNWWQRGKIRWRADVRPTLPFFVLALVYCATTAWLEKHHVGAQGPDFDLTFTQRGLIAGRAFWFYLGHLFWPANLCFVYPRWQPNPGIWWQWLYPVTALGTLSALWLARGRIGRGPAAALFYYVGTLFPLLGFINAYGMRYSYVWDHWVYLSAPGIFALVAALLVRAGESLRRSEAVYGLGAILLPVLALLTWRQAGMYRNMETLWRTTLARNPDAFMAHNNLGLLLVKQGHIEKAIEHYRRAIQLNPNDYEALNNLGNVLATKGQFDEAIEYDRKAIQINPYDYKVLSNLGLALLHQKRLDEAIENFHRSLQLNSTSFDSWYNLANALVVKGRSDEAIECFRKALQLNPDFAEGQYKLGNVLAAQGRLDEAIEHYRRAAQTNPNFSEALNNLGNALAVKGRFDEAIEHYRRAVQINPNYYEALDSLGSALVTKGRLDEAIENYRRAVQINPTLSGAQYNLGKALAAQGQLDEAIENYRRAIQINPNYYEALDSLGSALVTKGRLDEAIESYRRAVQINPNHSEVLNNLGVALADKGRLEEGIENFRQAIQINPNNFKALNNLGLALATQGRLDEAIENYHRAVQINPNYCEALDNLGSALTARGQFDEAAKTYRQAIQINSNQPDIFFHLGMALGQSGHNREAVVQYQEALRLNPNLMWAINNLAWELATSPDDGLRNGVEAVRLGEHACELNHYQEPLSLGTLAAAYAEAGRFPEAVATAEKAEQLATKDGLKAAAEKNRQLLEFFRANKPYHELPSPKP